MAFVLKICGFLEFHLDYWFFCVMSLFLYYYNWFEKLCKVVQCYINIQM